eukprot:TRINITY_DN6382_c0_g1_i1.p1 TRINITY_DN6382_c0_g1~~TRINITY_DN6382_c0_g1_i1.p1  ORF type:complete len:707 (-),score=160.40 TRINITY_DN6382_c0_g1_i1:1125-3215(-)
MKKDFPEEVSNKEKTMALFTTLRNIVKADTRIKKDDELFVTLFGVLFSTDIVDLFAALEFTDDERFDSKDGFEALFEIAELYDQPHIFPWVVEIKKKEKMTKMEAFALSCALKKFPREILPLCDLVPRSGPGFGYHVGGGMGKVVGYDVLENNDALIRARQIVQRFFEPCPLSVERAVDMLVPPECDGEEKELSKDDILKGSDDGDEKDMGYSNFFMVPNRNDQRREQPKGPKGFRKTEHYLDKMKRFIYGSTPLCKALRMTAMTFSQPSKSSSIKYLFVVSDGMATDGNPWDEMGRFPENVVIVTCFLTSNSLGASARCLHYRAQPTWSVGEQVLFGMSSQTSIAQEPLCFLPSHGWSVPHEGECRLFLRANSFDLLNEFVSLMVNTRFCQTQDALATVVGRVNLESYVNYNVSTFVPRNQIGGTCYANAIAATFHLAMMRIDERRGGYPTVEEIRDRMIKLYGSDGYSTKTALATHCREYRLQFREVSEIEARQAILRLRPVLVTFRFQCQCQWDNFSQFFKSNRTKVFKREHLGPACRTRATADGHAVVMTRCDANSLTMLNSWGTDWANGGFFKVKNRDALWECQFYDVFWTLDDLHWTEKHAFAEKANRRIVDWAVQSNSFKHVEFSCPLCDESSPVSEYAGNIAVAVCPKCKQSFKPTSMENIALLQRLYMRSIQNEETQPESLSARNEA